MSHRTARSLTLYHGTNQVFGRFDPTKVGKRDSGNLGRGIYLTKDPTFAMRYAEENAKRWGGEPVVLKVNANLGRIAPFYKMIPRLKAELGVKFPPTANDVKRSEQLREWFLAQGYDAAEAGSEIVVFDHRKLKVVGQHNVPTEQERLKAILKHFEATGEALTEQEMFGAIRRAHARRIAARVLQAAGYDPNYGYYAWKRGTSLQTVLDRWVNRGQKIYDNSLPAFYSPRELWPHREYTWTREEAGQGLARVEGKIIDLPGPLKWDALKVDLKARGWDTKDPAVVNVGKNGVIKVGEGNHRLAIARELGLSKVPVTFSFEPGVHKMPQRSKAERSKPIPPKAIEKAIKHPSKPLDPKTEAKVDEIMNLLGW